MVDWAHPEVVGGTVGAGLASLGAAGYLVRKAFLNSRNGSGSNGNGHKCTGTHCKDHSKLVQDLTETKTHVVWLRQKHESDNTREILGEVLAEVKRRR